jgi:sodium/hydrogen antiporter
VGPDVIGIGVFALLVIGYGLVSGRLEGTPVTAPMVFVAAGLAAGASGELDFASVISDGASVSGEPSLRLSGEALLPIAEIALALVLFTDAARLRLRTIRGNAELPSRLLLLGLPLTIALTGITAYAVLDGLVFWEALLLATIVAPTDAALGESVVTSPKLPVRIRQGLNVESGLNDGMAVPLFTIFLALAVAEEEVTAVSAATVIAEKIGYGLAVGIGVGLVGGALVRSSVQHEWITGLFQQLTIAAIGVFSWWAAEEIGGSGFIAAFVGGLVVGRIVRQVGTTIVDFTEDIGQLLNLFIFFAFGVISYELLDLVTWQTVAFAVLALTVLRMVPVALVLVGTGLRAPTVWFVGWFGPRGLATIILAYLAVADEPGLPGLTTVVVGSTVTVLLSVYAHGVTAAPFVRRYTAWCETMDDDSPEMQMVPELPTRMGMVGHAPRE